MPVLQGILKPIMIRRTKKSKNRYGENILNLPKKVKLFIILYNNIFKIL